jgi:hypothetical protein
MKFLAKTLITGLISTATLTAAHAEEDSAADKAAAAVGKLFEPVKISGGTTAADGFGALEASLLTATAVRNAAAKIATKASGHQNLLILTDDQAFDYSDLVLVEQQNAAVEALLQPFDQTIAAKCPVIVGSDGPAGGSPVIVAALAGLIPALQQETKLSSVSVTASSSMLVGAILEERSKNSQLSTYMLGSIAKPKLKDSEIAKVVLETERRSNCLKLAINEIPADTQDRPKAELRARMKAATDLFDGFAKVIATKDDKGRMPFYEALRQSIVAGINPTTLKIKVESSGGTTIVRKNFFTLFGAPAVGMTGGVVVSYSIVESGTNRATGGIAACPTGLVDLRAIHNGQGLAKSGDQAKCY